MPTEYGVGCDGSPFDLELMISRAKPQWATDPARGCYGMPLSVFWPEANDAETTARAQAACTRCPFTEECRDWAVDHGEDSGIWGGTTGRTRRKIKKRRRLLALHNGAA